MSFVTPMDSIAKSPEKDEKPSQPISNAHIDFSDPDSYVNDGNFLMLVDNRGHVTSLTGLMEKRFPKPKPTEKEPEKSEVVVKKESEEKEPQTTEEEAEKPKEPKPVDAHKLAQIKEKEKNTEALAQLEKLVTPENQANIEKVKGVYNDPRLTHVPKDVKPHHFGTILYHPPYFSLSGSKAPSVQPHLLDTADLSLVPLLPRLDSDDLYSTVDVIIPHRHLRVGGGYFPGDDRPLPVQGANLGVRRRCLWGTQIYSDDSDLFACLIHDGWYWPSDAPKPRKKEVKEALPAPVQDEYALPNPPSTPLMGPNHPHDVVVRVRILPRLQSYGSSLSHGILSRGWGEGHEGESIRIENVRVVETEEANRVEHLGKLTMADGRVLVKPSPHQDWIPEGSQLGGAKKRKAKKIHTRSSNSSLNLVLNAKGDAFCVYVPQYVLLWPPPLARAMSQMIDDRESSNVLKDLVKENPSLKERVEKLENSYKELVQGYEGVDLERMWNDGWFCWRVRVAGMSETLVVENDKKRFEIMLQNPENPFFNGLDRYVVYEKDLKGHVHHEDKIVALEPNIAVPKPRPGFKIAAHTVHPLEFEFREKDIEIRFFEDLHTGEAVEESPISTSPSSALAQIDRVKPILVIAAERVGWMSNKDAHLLDEQTASILKKSKKKRQGSTLDSPAPTRRKV